MIKNEEMKNNEEIIKKMMKLWLKNYEVMIKIMRKKW